MKQYFTRTELILWGGSSLLMVLSFVIFDRENYLTLAASLTGAASLILNAKGNPAGQALMIVFSVMYGIISYSYAYYGEMVTYLGMTAPMALFSLFSWLLHPYSGKHSEVEVNTLGKVEISVMLVLTVIVTYLFYHILNFFGTANIIPSTLSVTTSFLAVYLTFRRSPYFAAAYAANDIVLIVLWVMASAADSRYISVVVCFVMFLANDVYGFLNWRRMKTRQSATGSSEP